LIELNLKMPSVSTPTPSTEIWFRDMVLWLIVWGKPSSRKRPVKAQSEFARSLTFAPAMLTAILAKATQVLLAILPKAPMESLQRTQAPSLLME
jgi:hypothetical protein